MNIETGELRRLLGCDDDAPKGFVKLSKDEAEAAEKELGNKKSVILPEDHPLRMAVSERVKNDIEKKKKSHRKAARQARKKNRRK